MDLATIKVGNKLELDNGATVVVLDEPRLEARAVKVRYLDSPIGPEQVGKEQMVGVDEIYGVYTDDDLGQVR
jgi:hypothetical protein